MLIPIESSSACVPVNRFPNRSTNSASLSYDCDRPAPSKMSATIWSTPSTHKKNNNKSNILYCAKRENKTKLLPFWFSISLIQVSSKAALINTHEKSKRRQPNMHNFRNILNKIKNYVNLTLNSGTRTVNLRQCTLKRSVGWIGYA